MKLVSLVWAAALLVLPSLSHAATGDSENSESPPASKLLPDAGPHRLYLGAGVAPSALLLGNESLHGTRFDSHVGYGYRVSRNLEFGGDIGILPENVIVLPMIYLRPFVPLARDQVELGCNLRGGIMVLPEVYSKIGGSLGVGLDTRVWLTKYAGLQLSAQGVIGIGPDREVGYSEGGAQVGFLGLDAALAAVIRL